jgi:hypothetical protein
MPQTEGRLDRRSAARNPGETCPITVEGFEAGVSDGLESGPLREGDCETARTQRRRRSRSIEEERAPGKWLNNWDPVASLNA